MSLNNFDDQSWFLMWSKFGSSLSVSLSWEHWVCQTKSCTALQAHALQIVGARLSDELAVVLIAMTLALIVALFVMNWSLVMSGLVVYLIVQVCCNSAVVHGLSIVGSVMFVVVGGLMGDVLGLVVMTGLVGDVLVFGVVVVTFEAVISVSTVLVRVVVVMDGLVSRVVLTVGGVVVMVG